MMVERARRDGAPCDPEGRVFGWWYVIGHATSGRCSTRDSRCAAGGGETCSVETRSERSRVRSLIAVTAPYRAEESRSAVARPGRRNRDGNARRAASRAVRHTGKTTSAQRRAIISIANDGAESLGAE
jgi:hypothetical protein